MTKKKNKKSKGSNSSTSQSTSVATDDPFEDDTFVKDDDLTLTEADTVMIASLIATTNKSFQKTAVAAMEAFKGRCPLGLGYSMMEIFDESGPGLNDTIRRLNIIYILFRLPEIESALRTSKAPKKPNEYYRHIFLPFFTYAEGEAHLEHESLLARIILCNESQAVANLTVNEFIERSDSLKHYRCNHEEVFKWENENNKMWPELPEKGIPLPILHSATSCPREVVDASAQYAFECVYPYIPTVIPDKMPIMLTERYNKEHQMGLTAEEINYTDGIQKRCLGKKEVSEKLLFMFESLEPAAVAFEQALMEDSPDDFFPSDSPTPSELAAENSISATDEITNCIEKFLEGITLGPFQTRVIQTFLEDAPPADPHYRLLMGAVRDKELLPRVMFSNSKVTAEIMSRLVVLDPTQYSRLIESLTHLEVAVQPMEALVKILNMKMLFTDPDRKPVCEYIRYCIRKCEQSENHRHIRLVSNLIAKLVKEGILLAREMFKDARNFAMKFTSNRDATNMYTLVMVAAEPETSRQCLFLDFLQSLPEKSRLPLLGKPSCALFVFRMLPAITQQSIVQLIWNANNESSLWEKVELIPSLKLLQSLNIVDNGRNIEKSFRSAYLSAAMSGSSRCANLREKLVEEKKKQKDIGKKASERWDCILRYLALPSEQNMASVSATTRTLFRAANFTSGDGESDLEITSSGFQFLLLSPVEQMWTYILEYFKLEISNGYDIVELLELLIQIVLCATKGFEPGQRSYVLDENWSERQTELINHLRELGVIFIRKRKDGIFFLTPLVLYLASREDSETAIERTAHGSIIVETNFRLYAYTSSPLQLAILSTFTEMTYRFNDMSVGILTRESVRRALQVGITASQIVSFLRTNAHPQCLASSGPLNCLPVTVSDQIRLWEDERRRLNLTDSVLYSTFESENEFIGVRDFAASEGILMWADSVQKLVIVTEEGHDRVKQWWKANKR
ncbi:unnamed protein product [Caenorhabditis auriculariae]|uniref:General transcription factor IIH subunit 4 n=1 Tax=Caenorhabditis auriculariae TaxID=2777116 RepID=A0A8S1HQ02_9PELO|nr:unnamed protein product [Caenorhabditis auriculariae]